MKIDWFDFWLVFSGILLFFLLIGLIIRIFHWLKFRQELAYIKWQKIQDLIKKEPISLYKDISPFKEEMDSLMKDVCFDLYDRNIWDKTAQTSSYNFEESLDKLLDGKILNLIKEKDYLLDQKDQVILSLEAKNQKILKELINKMFFLLVEKDKTLKEKDSLIDHLKIKIQDASLIDLDKQLSQLLESIRISSQPQKQISTPSEVQQQSSVEKKYLHHSDFINVNTISKK